MEGGAVREHYLMRASSRIQASAIAAAILTAALSACSSGNQAQKQATALPTVSQVLQHFVDAVGGEKAILRPHSMTLRSDVTAYAPKQTQIHASLVVYLANFKRLQVAKVGRLTYLSGYDGKIGWSVVPGRKVEIVRGHDAISIRRDADMYYWTHVQRYFRSLKVVGIEEFAGRRCYHLRGTTLWNNENNQYYEVTSGLLAGFRFHQWIAGKAEKPETRQVFEGYKKFGGIGFATRETDFRNDKLVAASRLNSVQFDNVDPHVFTPPPAVRRLEH